MFLSHTSELRKLPVPRSFVAAAEHPFRVSTRSYHYKLRTSQGSDAWRMHWHPEGNSPITYTHLHLPPDLKRHLPSERMTFEKAIAWCAQFGAP